MMTIQTVEWTKNIFRSKSLQKYSKYLQKSQDSNWGVLRISLEESKFAIHWILILDLQIGELHLLLPRSPGLENIWQFSQLSEEGAALFPDVGVEEAVEEGVGAGGGDPQEVADQVEE